MRRWIVTLTAGLGLGLTPAYAAGPEISPEQAPAAWLAYAEAATQAITGWLNAETPPAPRVRAVLESGRPAADQPTPPLVVKVWVDRAGAVSRVEFAPLADAQADQDLHGLLVGRSLGPPPKRMRLPMRLALQLAPRPTSTPTALQTAIRGAAGRRLSPTLSHDT